MMGKVSIKAVTAAAVNLVAEVVVKEVIKDVVPAITTTTAIRTITRTTLQIFRNKILRIMDRTTELSPLPQQQQELYATMQR